MLTVRWSINHSERAVFTAVKIGLRGISARMTWKATSVLANSRASPMDFLLFASAAASRLSSFGDA